MTSRKPPILKVHTVNCRDMSDGNGTCEYVLDPDNPETWGGEKGERCYVDKELLNGDDVWTCPHDSNESETLCIFHQPLEEKNDEKVVESFVNVLDEFTEEDGDFSEGRQLQFIGAQFGEFDLSQNPPEVVAKDAEIDMSYVTVEGELNWFDAVFDISTIRMRGIECIKDSFFSSVEFGEEADFSRAEFGGEAYFYNTNFGGKADFRGAEFGGKAYFRGAEFGGKADFLRAEFGGKAEFKKIEIGGEAHFYNTKFGGEADFRETKFGGKADFGIAEFGKEAGFILAEFGGEADFRAEFGGGAHFLRAEFSGEADFRAEFSGEADFRRCEFDREADFRAEFGGEAHFLRTEFGGETNFRDVEFDREANFRDVEFDRGAKFRDVEFGGKSDFLRARFGGEAEFRDVEFGGEADFRDVEFDGKADFPRAWFGEEVNFRGAKFAGEADFSCTEFDEETYFGGVEFEKLIKFSKATFEKEPDFSSIVSLSDSQFGNVDLTDADFTGVTLHNADFENALLSRATLFGADLRGAKLAGTVLGDVRIDQDTQFLGHPDDDNSTSPHTISAIRSKSRCVYDPKYEEDHEESDVDKAKSVYRAVEELAAKAARPRLQSQCFIRRQDLQKDGYKRVMLGEPDEPVGEKDVSESEKKGNRNFDENIDNEEENPSFEERLIAGVRYSRAKAARITLLYGESPWRIIGISSVFILTVGLVYPVFGWLQPSEGSNPITWTRILEGEPILLLESIYFSTLTFISLGLGDYEPIGGGGQVLAIFNTAFGAILIALLVFVFGRRAAK